ncbi:hypothetical protein U3A58_11845 [Algoriphagus sp. C2-6-M1]|uniref:hypothetical protein n=1 Tax=Algoriphagus persicinus TaxID=3108754 RepID=UPI002B37BC71|nr:hypothetical protein [Algoriphagus sp. C2-6-M1]MEB2781087.1 hypothetical protein [Algoriphagus sp. C2-6-M1]
MSLPYKFLLLSVMALFVFSQNKLFAQVEKETKTESSAEIFTAKHAIYGELVGTSTGYAINYGFIFHQKQKLKYSASAGFSMRYQNEIVRSFSGFWIPSFSTEISALWGKSKGHLEFGTGFVAYRDKQFIFDEDFPRNIRVRQYWGKTIVPRIGYRYQKPHGGLFFRAAYTPWIEFNNIEGTEDKVNFQPFGIGLSLGWSF